MKKQILLLLALTASAVPNMSAAIVSQMLFDAGGGNSASVDVNDGGVIVITCNGLCSLAPTLVGGDHGTLGLTGTLGVFTINSTGQGEPVTADPVRQTLNQTIVKNGVGAATLTVTYTDTNYANLGSFFSLAASTSGSGGTTDFFALADSAGALPATQTIGSFLGLTGSDNDAGVFANPIGLTGSLSSRTVLSFTGAGTVEARFTIADVAAVPEPSSFAFVASACIAGLGLRRRFARR